MALRHSYESYTWRTFFYLEQYKEHRSISPFLVIILNPDQWIRCCVKSSVFSSGDYSVQQSRGRLDLAVLFTPSTPNRQNRNQVRWNIWGRLDLAVLFSPSTPNRQNRNQVRWNTCAGVRRSIPSSKVVQTEQSRDLFQNKWWNTAYTVLRYFSVFPNRF